MPKSFLKRVGTIIVPEDEVCDELDVKDFTGEIANFSCNDEFEKVFGKTVQPPTDSTHLAVERLEANACNKRILEAVGEIRAEINLQMALYAIGRQSEGQDGELLVHGGANIFFIADDRGKLWSICAFFDLDQNGWVFDAYLVNDDPECWPEGSYVLLRARTIVFPQSPSAPASS